MFLLGILVGVFTLLLVDAVKNRHRILKYMDKFPSAPRHVIFGNLLQFKGQTPSGE